MFRKQKYYLKIILSLAKKTKKETPLMKQYNAIKAKYPDALLLFRVGDFYETFGEDAKKAAKILGIVMTKRGAGSETETALAGFPHHSLNTYLPKLVKAGLRVAICDQLEDPKMTKTPQTIKLNKSCEVALEVVAGHLFVNTLILESGHETQKQQFDLGEDFRLHKGPHGIVLYR